MKKITLILSLALYGFQSLAQTSPLNGDFEDTLVINSQGVDLTYSQNWNWSGFGAGLTNDAVTGSKAAYIWNWYFYAKGYIKNGNPSDPSSHGAPIDFRPSALTGSFKYIIGDVVSLNDSAVGTVYLTKFNTNTLLRDTLARALKKFGPADDYQTFTMPINFQTSETPDSVFISFESSQNGFCSNSSDGNCLFFYLDNLNLINPSASIIEPVDFQKPIIFPNPSKDKIQISNPSNLQEIVEIFTADGKLISALSISPNSVYPLDCANFESGIYFIQFANEKTCIKWIKN